MKLRAAAALDAPDIGRVQVETWRSAYRGIVPDEYLAGLSAPERAAWWGERLADQSGGRFALSADHRSGELIGFAAAGPERSGHPVYRREVYAIYVLPSHQRRGVGRALMQAVAARLAAERSAAMLLWVLEANAPAPWSVSSRSRSEEQSSRRSPTAGSMSVLCSRARDRVAEW
jgi:GNAT superfamily N-acetyltransferase